jgi:hypothetical protein
MKEAAGSMTGGLAGLKIRSDANSPLPRSFDDSGPPRMNEPEVSFLWEKHGKCCPKNTSAAPAYLEIQTETGVVLDPSAVSREINDLEASRAIPISALWILCGTKR